MAGSIPGYGRFFIDTHGMLSSLNSMQREKDRLIDISADGMIDNDELPDFILSGRRNAAQALPEE